MEITKEIILENIDNPKTLEDLYQDNNKTFSKIIEAIYEQESDLIIKYWYFRLFNKSDNKNYNVKKYFFTAFLVIFAWVPVRLQFADALSNNLYLTNAIPVVFSAALSVYFLFDSVNIRKILLCIVPNLFLYIYFIMLPDNAGSQSLHNAYLFMFVILWFFVLFVYSGCNIKNLQISVFLEKLGETIIWSTILIIGGIVVVGLSLALFSAIKIDVFVFYLKNVVTLGLVASPFVSLLVIENNKIKLSVIIANIFLPIILISIVAFGITSIFAEIKPYEDRDIFIIYNIMMVVVICILIFTSINGIKNKFINICSYILPIITVILDIITISAVIYRLTNYGITANKITLLGTNIVMLGHLTFMLYLKYRHRVEQNIEYLPVYLLWALVIVFLFPFIFRMT